MQYVNVCYEGVWEMSPKICCFGMLITSNWTHLGYSKFREKPSMNFPYLCKERTFKKNSVIMNPPPMNLTNQERSTCIMEEETGGWHHAQTHFATGFHLFFWGITHFSKIICSPLGCLHLPFLLPMKRAYKPLELIEVLSIHFSFMWCSHVCNKFAYLFSFQFAAVNLFHRLNYWTLKRVEGKFSLPYICNAEFNNSNRKAKQLAQELQIGSSRVEIVTCLATRFRDFLTLLEHW